LKREGRSGGRRRGTIETGIYVAKPEPEIINNKRDPTGIVEPDLIFEAATHWNY
jgi:hypothetical protein